MPADQILPMAVTSIAVTAVKVIAIAGGILLMKWILSKLKKSKRACNAGASFI